MYNGSKSVCCFIPRDINLLLLTFIIANGNLQYVNSHKYLGVIFEDGNCDKDVIRQLKTFHINANLILRKFGNVL